MKLLDLAIPGWVRLAGGLVVVLCIAWLLAVVKGWHDDSRALPGVQQQLKDSRAETEQVRTDLKAEASRLAKINEGLANENETLRGVRAATPVRSVRLCPATPGPTAVEAHPAAPGGSDAAPAGAGPLPAPPGPDPAAGPDIGPDLYALMDEADEAVKRARAGQVYIAGLPQACLAQP